MESTANPNNQETVQDALPQDIQYQNSNHDSQHNTNLEQDLSKENEGPKDEQAEDKDGEQGEPGEQSGGSNS